MIVVYVYDVYDSVITYRGQGKEGDGKDWEAGGHDLPHPGAGHRVPVPDGGHRNLQQNSEKKRSKSFDWSMLVWGKVPALKSSAQLDIDFKPRAYLLYIYAKKQVCVEISIEKPC